MKRWDGETDSPNWKSILKDARGKLVFDIGANVGQASHVLSEGFTRVISFEPCWESFEVLAEECRSNVTVSLLAMSDHEGVVELAESANSIQSGQLTSGTVAGEKIGWGEVLRWRSVPCSTIDIEVNEYGIPDAVKVDTEGHELEVIAGGLHLLNACTSQWFLEMHDRANEQHVRTLFHKYKVTTVNHLYAPPPFDNYYMWCRP